MELKPLSQALTSTGHSYNRVSCYQQTIKRVTQSITYMTTTRIRRSSCIQKSFHLIDVVVPHCGIKSPIHVWCVSLILPSHQHINHNKSLQFHSQTRNHSTRHSHTTNLHLNLLKLTDCNSDRDRDPQIRTSDCTHAPTIFLFV